MGHMEPTRCRRREEGVGVTTTGGDLGVHHLNVVRPVAARVPAIDAE